MNARLKRLWHSTTENAIWICYAILMLFSVSGKSLFYMSVITAGGLLLYFYDAVTSSTSDTDDTEIAAAPSDAPDDFKTIMRKLWRITEANGIWIAMGISAIYYLEGTLAVIGTGLTILGFCLFYIYAYGTTELIDIDYAALPPFSWRTFAQNMWTITESNILTIAGSIALLLYVSGRALVYTAIFIIIGCVLFYIDAYRQYLIPEPPTAAADETNQQSASATIPLTNEE